MSRRLVGASISIAWLLAMAVLVRRELYSGTPRDALLNDSAWIEEPIESWLTLHGPAPQSDESHNTSQPAATAPTFGPRVGYARIRQAPEQREGVEGSQLDLEVRMELPLLGRMAALDLRGSAWRARHQRLAQIDFSIRSGEADFRLQGTIVGDKFSAHIESGGESSQFETKLATDALFSTGFGTAVAFPVLELGERRVVQSFDPMTLRSSRAVIRAVSTTILQLGDEEVPATRLEVRSNGLRTFAWVDATGGVLQATTPLGLSMRRATQQLALAPVAPLTDASELLRITAIQPSGPRPQRGAKTLTVRIPGVAGWAQLTNEQTSTAPQTFATQTPTDDLAIPLDWRQQSLQDSRFRFRASTYPASATDVAEPPSDRQLEVYLESDVFIQSDHPKIRARAEAIINERIPRGANSTNVTKGTETATDFENQELPVYEQAMALHDWVFNNVEKIPVLSLPSALEVLSSRKGDCNEHTILYTALARSIGLPTRVAIGLVWSDTYDGFYYHAWPEVWLDNHSTESGHRATWIALDPTLGQPLADATHIKLLEGGIDRWLQLLPFLGRLEIEILQDPEALPSQ